MALMVPAASALDFVHELHGLDDAQHVADRDALADLGQRLGARGAGAVEGADHRGLGKVAVLRQGAGSLAAARSGRRGGRGDGHHRGRGRVAHRRRAGGVLGDAPFLRLR